MPRLSKLSRSIEGKIALVTGSNRGIGKAIADMLGTRGAIVVGTATSEEFTIERHHIAFPQA